MASSTTHREALIRAFSQIRVDTTTSPNGLIHMLIANRATCIVFSGDGLRSEGLDHTRPLYISVGFSRPLYIYMPREHTSAITQEGTLK